MKQLNNQKEILTQIKRVSTRQKANEYITKNNIKFNIDDYVGEWYDKNHQFNFNKDLTFQYDVSLNGKCRLIHEENTSILMECIVNGYDNILDNVYLFHSVPTKGDGSYNMKEAAKLGRTQGSHGCIRLSVPDSKWLMDNIPDGTKVVIKDH